MGDALTDVGGGGLAMVRGACPTVDAVPAFGFAAAGGAGACFLALAGG
jgi:hypothetical protein